MKRTVRGTLKLFAWLSLIVAFASYSVIPAFARMPPRDSTTSENSRLRDQTTRAKIVDLTKQRSVKPLKNLGQLQIIDFKMVSTTGEFNKRGLTADEIKAVKGALSKAIAVESLTNDLGQLEIIDLNTLSARVQFNKRSLSAEEMKALKYAVTKAAACAQDHMVVEGGWWSCMKGCLGDVGVSAYSLIICGATCVTGAVPICAICLGVSVAVIQACGVGCAIYE